MKTSAGATHISLTRRLAVVLTAPEQMVRPYTDGVYDQSLPALPYEEFQTFGNTPVRMREGIRRKINELKRHHDHPEEIAGQRPLELSTAKEQAENQYEMIVWLIRDAHGETNRQEKHEH